jgi:hypothetical protein
MSRVKLQDYSKDESLFKTNINDSYTKGNINLNQIMRIR